MEKQPEKVVVVVVVSSLLHGRTAGSSGFVIPEKTYRKPFNILFTL